MIPGAYNRRFFAFFAWYTRRLLRSRFFSVRMARGSADALAALDAHDGPAVVVMNHPSWWDPLVCVYLADAWTPSRTPFGVIDQEQLRRFAFMRRLGLFGIDPADPSSLRAMVDHVTGLFRTVRRPTFWITPQGRFTDVREPVRLRPGAGTILARTPSCRAVAVSVELAFWNDQKPEVFLLARTVPPPGPPHGPGAESEEPASTTQWHRAIEHAMEQAAQELSALVIAREEGAFDAVLGGATRIHPVYDLWLSLRGARGAIAPAHHRASAGRAVSP